MNGWMKRKNENRVDPNIIFISQGRRRCMRGCNFRVNHFDDEKCAFFIVNSLGSIEKERIA